jgi:predicted ribosomally synthesized peptide with SipW-like signal peptide
MKTKIFVVLALVASIAMFSTGAFAWFTSTRTLKPSTITAGTLELQVANGTGVGECGAASYGTTANGWSFDKMVPGEFVDATICLKNNGNVDMGRVWYDWSDLVNTPIGMNFAGQLKIVDIRDSLDGANQAPILAGMGINTLADLANLNNAPDFTGSHPDAWSATSVYPYINAGQTGWMYMKLQFNENADDNFQGVSLTYKTTIKATQKTALGQ